MRKNEFWGARAAAVVLSMVGWTALFASDRWASCSVEPCEPAHIDVGDLEFISLFVGVFHLGLLISLIAERGGWLARLIGAVALLPAFALTVVWTGAIIFDEGPAYFSAPFGLLLFLHAMQFWRLSGFAFPRIQPVRRDLQNYAAPGAERIAGR